MFRRSRDLELQLGERIRALLDGRIEYSDLYAWVQNKRNSVSSKPYEDVAFKEAADLIEELDHESDQAFWPRQKHRFTRYANLLEGKSTERFKFKPNAAVCVHLEYLANTDHHE